MPKTMEIDVWIENGYQDEFEDLLYNEDIKHVECQIVDKREEDCRYSYVFMSFVEELSMDYLGYHYQIKNVFV